MARPKVPNVETARRMASKFDLDRVIIWYEGKGQVGFASYGRNRSLCDDTGVLADKMFEIATEHLRGDNDDG